MEAKHGNATDVPIAIIGMAFEFPQDATSGESFWKMILEGRSASTDFPSDRMNIDAFYHPDDNRPSSIPLRGGHFLKKDLGAFDAPFFSITADEAACMDPQHRHLLETTYHALEDSGIPISKCTGSSTSVYTGCFTNDYLSILQQDLDAEQRHAAMGVAPSMLANRLSWFFDFKGTSMNLDSACSSSLIALHLACQDLQTKSSEMAVVGGANLVYHPNFMKIMSNFNFLSRDSRCWSFDRKSNGYSRGEGIAVVVLKRIDDAIRDGDTIRAVIRNTGSNQDGRTQGITQPSQEAQINLIKRTYLQAKLDMEPTRFFEAHATGTPVGDPVEGNAIGAAFRGYRSESDPLYIGAVKASIGHLEGASGLAGIIKTILVLENGIIPPIAGFESLNDRIDAKALKLHFPTVPVPWPPAVIRRACINSFGFGGTNAVAILDDAHSYLQLKGLEGLHRTRPRPLAGVNSNYGGQEDWNVQHQRNSTLTNTHKDTAIYSAASISNAAKVLVWSASDQHGVQSLSNAYKVYIESHANEIDDLAYTLAVRRSHFSWRSFAVLGSGIDTTFSRPVKTSSSDAGVAFVFTGQGAQYVGMGRQLLAYTTFQESLVKSNEFLKILDCQWSLLDIMAGESDISIDSPEYSQPLTTCLQLALVDLLQSWGIVPSVVLGHSSGEIAAAYAAKVLSQFSAVKISYYRGKLSSELAAESDQGLSMMAVGLSREDVNPYLTHLKQAYEFLDIDIGCVNSPKSVTLTGNAQQLSTLEKILMKDHVFSRKLRVNIAYHSRFMMGIADKYLKAIEEIKEEQSIGLVPMISSVTGDVVAAETLASADYWVRNLTSTVEFEAAFGQLLARASKKPRKQLGKKIIINPINFAVGSILEIGPHSALQGPIRECLQAFEGITKPGYIPSLHRSHNASFTLLNAVGALYCNGNPVNLLGVNDLAESPRPAPAEMPKYPFNHSQSHWREGQLSRNLRFREKPRHDLFGTRSLDWNPLMAQWRNVIRLEELPWLEDHTIGGDIVLPASGMIVMATEALKQLINDDLFPSVRGINIQNATFSHAISFPKDVGKVETQLSISRSSPSSDLSTWSYFRLFLLENGSYIECCSGLIRAIVDDRNRDKVVSSGPWTPGQTPREWMGLVKQACGDSERDPYIESLDTTVRYGPAFRNLEHVRVGNQGEAVALINTETWKLKTTGSADPSFVVHPTTLDGLAQPFLQALLAQNREKLPTMVPVYIANLWVNCSRKKALSEGKISVMARCSFDGYRGGTADVVATAINSSEPLIFMNGLETRFISDFKLGSPQQTLKPRFLCTKLAWKPDLDTMTDAQIFRYCVSNRPPQEVDAEDNYRSLIICILCFVLDTISFVDQHPQIESSPHLQAYAGWLRYQQKRLCDGTSQVTQDSVQRIMSVPEERERLVSQIETSGVVGFFFMQIGRNINKMLLGEIDPLEFMFNDGLANRYYEKMLANDHHAYPASRYIELLSFTNPSMNILEVGAGTGGQTMRLLDAMSSDGIKKWAKYDYTDISSGFFSQARNKFAKYTDRMSFKVCDISEERLSPSFEEGTYDLVVASHVLHATDFLAKSLRNIRKLLKPNGKLLLFETTRPEAILGFAFGLLKGWWSPLDHEQRSPHSPCLTVAQWDMWLKQAGFSGVDIEIPGQESPLCRDGSIIITSASQIISKSVRDVPQINIVVDCEVKAQQILSKLLVPQLNEVLGASCEIFTLAKLAEVITPASSITIFLVEVDTTLVDNISEVNFRDLQATLVRGKNTIWITRSISPDQEPQHHLAIGMGRALMSEESSRKFMTLCLNEASQDPAQVVKLICELTKRLVNLPVENIENNYVAAGGMLNICRVTENLEMDTKVAQAILPLRRLDSKLADETPINLRLGAAGHVDTVEWIESDTESKEYQDSDSPTQGGEVEVQVRAIGLTFRDHLIVSGQLDESELGTECAGVVRFASDNSGFDVGDRVCLIAASTSRSIIRVRSSAVIAIPPSMGFVEAASMPTSMWLSYRALVDIGRVEVGETVLIHRASSCVGQIAVQLAKRLGAKVLVTCSSGPGNVLLHEQLTVPKIDIFDTDDGSMVSKIYSRTGGSGVDVIIGPLNEAREGLSFEFSACLAPFGRLVDISLSKKSGSMKGLSQSGIHNLPNITRADINLVDLLHQRPLLAHSTFQRAAKTIFGLSINHPLPLHIFEAREVEAAFCHFGIAGIGGKRVIEMKPDMKISAKMKNRPTYSFRSDATYVIAGGLGGLGRSFARWMVSRGARYLILLSRSGGSGREAKSLIAELESQGVDVATPSIDISNLKKLREEMGILQKRMPLIKGCIQATVALRDNLFPNMTYDDWIVGTGSKATGSWNLHTILPLGLDFFILIASLNGIVGGRAQANYAAGNTFKDALAHHRISLGEKAVAIDLGLMVTEGVIAENEFLLASMRRLGHLMDISQGELLALLDYYCDPALPLLSQENAQVLVGIETPTAVLSKGIDLQHSIHRPMFRHLFQIASSSDEIRFEETAEDRDRGGALQRAKSDEQACELVATWFIAKLSQVLGLDAGEVDPEQPVHAYGIDSLVAIDLKNWFTREIKADVQVFLILGNASIQQLAREAATKSEFLKRNN